MKIRIFLGENVPKEFDSERLKKKIEALDNSTKVTRIREEVNYGSFVTEKVIKTIDVTTNAKTAKKIKQIFYGKRVLNIM